MKDYYEILGINIVAGELEIKKVYRKLALRYHPDRDPGNHRSEERFKEIAEAYAVLIDRRKRDEYDRLRKAPSDGPGKSGAGFRYNQSHFSRDMFHSPDSAAFFSELEKEFKKQGFRFDELFFNDLFSRRRDLFSKGIYGRHDSRPQADAEEENRPVQRFERRAEDNLAPGFKDGILKVIPQIARKGIASRIGRISGKAKADRDLICRIRISKEEARTGAQIRFAFDRGSETEKLSIRIPSGIQSGAQLKLAGMGLPGNGSYQAGDLYIKIEII